MARQVPPNKRLIDYYFVVTASDRAKTGTIQRLANEPLAPRGATKPIHAKFAWKPKIVDRYPAHDHGDTPLRAWVARSSLPRGVRARTRPPPPRFATFVGWNVDGCKLYGAVIEVFEKLKIPHQQEKVYMPKVLGFLSHYPFFYAFEVFLRCLWYGIPKDIIRLEDLLVHYFYHIPVPAPGQKIAYDSGGPQKVLVTQRNEFDIPIPELPQDVLFSRLSVDRICWILCHLISSQRVIFVASQETELCIAGETFSALLFPLRWCYLYVPNASKHVALSLAKFDGPFMVGVPLFLYKRDEVKAKLPGDALIVELDANRVWGCEDGNGRRVLLTGPPSPTIPNAVLPELHRGIHALSRILTMPMDEVNARRSRSDILSALRVCFNVVRYTIAHCVAYHQDPALISHYQPSEQQFFHEFADSEMYRSFVQYYQRVNPDDEGFRKIYQFYKQHEALGKEFARPVAGSMRVAFDKRVYNTKNFVVDKKLIARMEKPFLAHHVDTAYETPSTLSPKVGKRGRKRTRSGAAAAATPSANDEEPTFSVKRDKRRALIPPEFAPNVKVMSFLNRHMLSVQVNTPYRSNPSSRRGTPMRQNLPMWRDPGVRVMSREDVRFEGFDEASEISDITMELPDHLDHKEKDSEERGRIGDLSIEITRTYSSRSSSAFDEDDTENLVVSSDNLSHLEHFNETQTREFSDSDSNWSLSEESGAEITDIEEWETESVLSDVGSVGSAGRRGRSSASLRNVHRFRQLNEFELDEDAKRNFRTQEREHNSRVNGVRPRRLATFAGPNLFTKEIMDAWTRSLTTPSRRMTSPPGSTPR